MSEQVICDRARASCRRHEDITHIGTNVPLIGGEQGGLLTDESTGFRNYLYPSTSFRPKLGGGWGSFSSTHSADDDAMGL